MKTLRALSIVLLLALTICYFVFVYKNNTNIPPPSNQEIQKSLDRSIDWVLKNGEKVLTINNPVLWWFLDESANLTNSKELAHLVEKYKKTTLDHRSVWSGYWVKNPPFTYITGSLNKLKKYQQFFIYSLTCDSDLGEEKQIQDQFDEGFCNWHPYYSSCITHQMMGVRLLQIKGCGDTTKNKQLSKSLANLIERQLVWDPRVGDVYIQRVLMLVESGNTEKVKPVWLKNILQEQRGDGGWANFYKLLSIGKSIELGFGYKYPDIITTPTSNFHTTAQAIYLLSLMTAKHNIKYAQ